MILIMLVQPVSVRAERQVTRLTKDYYPEIVAAHKQNMILSAQPMGVENARYGENTLLSFVIDFGKIKGLLPVHEVGVPVYPVYRSGEAVSEEGDLWSFLALGKKDKKIIERRMIRIMQSGCPLSFTIMTFDGEVAILSRRAALERLKERVRLEEGQRVHVTVILTTSRGAWCDYQGINVYIPRHEVFWGDVSPGEVLELGNTYEAVVKGVDDLVRASIKDLEADPWETFDSRPGSVLRAVIKEPVTSAENRFRVTFKPGVNGVAQGAPLCRYYIGQSVNVRIIKVIPERRFILGRIEE
jgi:hypothetical protein